MFPINPEIVGPPLVDCTRILDLHILSYLPYLWAVCCKWKLQMRHAEVGGKYTAFKVE